MLKSSTIVFIAVFLSSAGCALNSNNRAAELLGKTYYLDGAGNYGFGQLSVPKGLRLAGYKGDVEIYRWTSIIGGAVLDQLDITNAKLKAKFLSKRIEKYFSRHPGNQVNIIALSAGSGVAVWAIESLESRNKVDNLVLLGSSLSNNYPMTEALRHLKGKVYVYHSPNDPVLEIVTNLSGTIDRKFGVECAGKVGLMPPDDADEATRRLYRDKIVNVAYRTSFQSYGYVGDHTSSTSSNFVSRVIAPNLVRKTADMHAGAVDRRGTVSLVPELVGPKSLFAVSAITPIHESSNH
jgi:hypothetical protein